MNWEWGSPEFDQYMRDSGFEVGRIDGIRFIESRENNMPELSNDVKVIAAVITERKRQDMQWGGPAHDDTHTPYDWLSYMGHQADLISQALSANGFYNYKAQEADLLDNVTVCSLTRQHFIKIAALAVAAVESLDRKNKS